MRGNSSLSSRSSSSSASRRSVFCRERARRRILVASPTRDLVPQDLQHPLEPLAVAAGLNADEHFSTELRIEVADIGERVMKKTLLLDLAVAGVAPLDELLPGV